MRAVLDANVFASGVLGYRQPASAPGTSSAAGWPAPSSLLPQTP